MAQVHNPSGIPNSQDIVDMVLNFDNHDVSERPQLTEDLNTQLDSREVIFYPAMDGTAGEIMIDQELQNFAEGLLMGNSSVQQYQDVKPVVNPEYWLMSQINSTVVNQSLRSSSGEYGFRVSFDQQDKVTKNMTWTFSNEVSRLYVMLNTLCPFKISTTRPPPENSYIVCVAAFKDAVSRRENVVRCPHHCRNQDTANDVSGKFWMTCNHNQTIYHEDVQNNNRHCLIVPFEKPHEGCVNYTYLIEFMCRNTCVGGVNRRSTEVVFLLQHEGKELGRSVVEVKVCACPGRDRRHDETALAKRISLETSKTKPQHSGLQSKALKMSQESLNLSNATDEHEAATDEWFTIKVKGKANFEILKRVAEGLELRTNQKMKKRKLNEVNKGSNLCNQQLELKKELDIVYSDG